MDLAERAPVEVRAHRAPCRDWCAATTSGSRCWPRPTTVTSPRTDQLLWLSAVHDRPRPRPSANRAPRRVGPLAGTVRPNLTIRRSLHDPDDADCTAVA